MTIPVYYSHDWYGSKAEIEGLYKEIQRRHLNQQHDFQYQGFRLVFLLRRDENYGKVEVGKKIHADFSWTIRIKETEDVDKEYPLTALRYLNVFLDNVETHDGEQANRDYETDQFLKDQGSISIRETYSGQLSETKARMIVDRIESVHREAFAK